MHAPLPSPWILSRRWPLVWLATGLAVGALAASAEPVTIPAQENDTVTFQATGNDSARAELTLARSPATSNGATLKVVDRQNFVFWSGELSRQGNRWTAQLNPDALEAMLMVDRMIAEFPGAAEGNEALQIVIPREQYASALKPLAPFATANALFFTPPPAPERPAVPSTDIERVRAESFAMTARRWERELAAYVSQFSAARSRAHALFLDLRTAGRLPWPDETLDQIQQGYQALEAKGKSLQQTLAEWRSTASSFVQQWNAAHSGQPPIELTFAEEASS